MTSVFSPSPFAGNGMAPHVLSQSNRRALGGINLAGAEFGSDFPGTFGQTYTYPTAQNLDYYAAMGRTLVRLPFRWERIQRAPFDSLDEGELARLKSTVRAAGEREMRVVLDVHNYGRYVFPGQSGYAGEILGSHRLPPAALGDLWGRLAVEFGNEDAIYAYGLMNEPHDMEGAHRWPLAAQSAIDAIRAVDSHTPICVPGDHWTSARSWRQSENEWLPDKIGDPQNNLIFEAHCYFDADNSGTYKGSYNDEGAHPDCGVEYVRPFVEWCREKGVRGFIGEYGIPDTDTRWLVVMDRFLAFLQSHQMSSAYWAAGPWWHHDPMAIEPRLENHALVDRPQMLVLRSYPG